MVTLEELHFTKEQEDIIRKYLQEDWFKELNSKVNMYDEEASVDEQIDHVRKYFYYYCIQNRGDINEEIENFFSLLEYYKEQKFREPIRDKEGYIDIYKSGFNSGNAFYTEKLKPMKAGKLGGHFASGIFITPDRKVFIKKYAMDAKGQMHSLSHHEQSRFNATVAKEVFDYFGEKSANYLPAIEKWPYYYVLSENFLNNNQELITFDEFYFNDDEEKFTKHSEILKLLETNLKIRYKNNMTDEEFNKLINKLRLQYLKQAFIKRIIGLKDENFGNIGIVLTVDKEKPETPEIDISPAFDLDMSFNLADETQMFQMKTDNGKADIKSFVEEYGSIQEFREFIDDVINKISNEEVAIETILNNAYDVSKAEYLKNEDKREEYKGYLRNTFEQTRQAYNELFINFNEKGEEDDVKTFLD